MNNINKLVKNNNTNTKEIIKGYICSIITSVIFLFIYAVVLVNTNVQESTMKVVIIIITGLSILIGSSLSSLKIKKNGLFNGIVVGIIYIMSLYVLSSIAISGFAINLSTVIMIMVGIVLGGIGGIVGVNMGGK